MFGAPRAQRAHGIGGADKRGQTVGEIPVRVHRGQHAGMPVARTYVEQPRPRRIAAFHDEFAGQVMVEVIVGQKDGRKISVQLWVVVPEPGYFRCRVARQDRIAHVFDALLLAAEA